MAEDFSTKNQRRSSKLELWGALLTADVKKINFMLKNEDPSINFGINWFDYFNMTIWYHNLFIAIQCASKNGHIKVVKVFCKELFQKIQKWTIRKQT
jgi:hypothetical protein